jgi:FMN-dependent oxidoreductase (nitrilotriacetate monooxygenase family)
MFHLGWFLRSGITVQGWQEPGYSAGYDFTKPDLFQDSIRALERACFDVLIIEDTSAVPYTFQGTMDFYLKKGLMTPKLDPLMIAPLLASVTKHIGIAPTLTTTFYPPWLLARALATLDHYSNGRAGFNIVTATSDAAAQNYGYDKHFEHDLRYDMADEFLDLVGQLWNAWEPGALVMDAEKDIFIDPTKVKPVNFVGEHYKSRGPLNVPRSPQGRPVYVTPGGSPRGRKFSGRNAEIVLASGHDAAAMKDYRDEVLKHAVSYGRDPATVKTMFAIVPTVVRDAAEAEEVRRNMEKMTAGQLDHRLAAMSFLSGIDFSKFDADQPVGEITTNGMQSMLKMFAKHGPQATLREIMTDQSAFSTFIGTPDHIAGVMKETMEEVGGDGFLIAGVFKPKFVTAIVDELVPVLQKRGLTRGEYGHETFRENLMAF